TPAAVINKPFAWGDIMRWHSMQITGQILLLFAKSDL
ncbi:MAG: hypothetical protein ACI822_000296, partial [Gammaproteobacteria bacterium]